MATNDRQLLGIVGENIACAELQQRGYEILARRYRTRHGEIDIIAKEGETTVFIEVKTRTGDDFGDGADAVDAWKQRRIAKMAVDFLARHQLHDRPCRFDVVAIDVSGATTAVDVYTHAFDGFE